MSKTIEERLTNIRGLQRRVSSGAEQAEGDALIAAVAAIIAGWNAAVEAMKDAASYAYSSGYTYCRVCRLAKVMGHQEWCFVGKLQAAIALMEGTDAEDN